MAAATPNPPNYPARVELDIGRYTLVLGDRAGAGIAAGAGSDRPRALEDALAASSEQPSRSLPSSAEGVLGGVSEATSKAERALGLFTEIAEGRLDAAAISDELDALLSLLGRLDRDEHFAGVLELARSLAMLLALLRRWVELFQTLKLALAAAERIGDRASRAWALHELGTLHLAAERYADCDRLLEQARDLREQIGDRRALKLTEHNLQTLCRMLRLQLGGTPPHCTFAQLLRRPVLAVPLALALLLAGGVAGAAIRGSAASSNAKSRSTTGTAANQAKRRTATPSPTPTSITSPVPATHALSLIKRGTGSGTLVSGDGRLSCREACSFGYRSTTTLTLSAVAAPGSTFTGWIGDCSGTSTCRLRMSEDRHVTGVFTLAALTLTLSSTGTGKGAIKSTDGQIDCSEACTASYAPGSQITLTETPEAGSRFTGWGGACSGFQACQLALGSNESVTADFTVAIK